MSRGKCPGVGLFGKILKRLDSSRKKWLQNCPGECPNPHAGLPVSTCNSCVFWFTLVNTQTHRQLSEQLYTTSSASGVLKKLNKSITFMDLIKPNGLVICALLLKLFTVA